MIFEPEGDGVHVASAGELLDGSANMNHRSTKGYKAGKTDLGVVDRGARGSDQTYDAEEDARSIICIQERKKDEENVHPKPRHD
jgi:hypothetical protein